MKITIKALAIILIACLSVSAIPLLASEKYVSADTIETPYDGIVINDINGDLVLHPADRTMAYSDTFVWRLQGSIFVDEIENITPLCEITGTLFRYTLDGIDGYHLIFDLENSTFEITQLHGTTSWSVENKILKMSFAHDTGIPNWLTLKLRYGYLDIDVSALKTIDTVYTLTKADYPKDISVYTISADLITANNLPTEDYCLVIPATLRSNNDREDVPIRSISSPTNSSLNGNLRYVIFLSPSIIQTGGSGGGPFENCPNLSGFTFLGTSSVVNKYFLGGCFGLESLTTSGTLDGGQTSMFDTMFGYQIDFYPLRDCTNLKRIIFNGDTTLKYASTHKEWIETGTPIDSISYLVSTFTGATNLEKIIVTGNGTKLGDLIFSEYDSGDDKGILGPSMPFDLIIAGKNISIGKNAFINTTKLRSIQGWENISALDQGAFLNVESLESVFISKNLAYNVETAFEGCMNITSFVVDAENPYYSYVDGILFNAEKTTVRGTLPTMGGEVVLPNTVTTVGLNAFKNRDVPQVTLNEGLRTIEEGAFNGCSGISEVTIPSSVINIGANAFLGCADVGTITYFCDPEILTLGENHIPVGWTEIWESAASGYRIYYDGDLVKAVYEKDGTQSNLINGSVFMEGTATFSVPSNNFEILNWIVKVGDSESIEYGSILTVVPQGENITVSVNLRYFSQSNVTSPFIDVKTPTSVSDWAHIWDFRSDKTTGGGMGSWIITSTPLIIDGYVYTYVSNMLYKNDALNGEVVRSVQYQDAIVESAPYYVYLGYGNGYIIHYKDDKVYDQDLNVVASFGSDIKASFYNDGYVYGLFAGDLLKKFSIDENNGNVTINYVTDGAWNNGVSVTDWHYIYGTTSAPVFSDDYLYYIESTATSDGKPNTANICSINLANGSKKAGTGLGLDGRYLDDGWLTLDGDKLYITTYNTGLFNEESTDTTNSYIKRMSLSADGEITMDFNVYLDYRGATSQFIIHNGRGYVNVGGGDGGFLYVFDMGAFSATSKPVYTAKSTYTHGSIVLGRGYTEENGTAYIYIVPYQLTMKGLVVFEDKPGQMAAKRIDLPLESGNYTSQAVRAGLNGQLMFYNDPGVVGTYGFVDDNIYNFFVKDGDSAQWYSASGKTPAEAFASLGNSVATLGSSKNITSVNGKTGTWNLYVLHFGTGTYSWVSLNNFGSFQGYYYDQDHYFFITDGASIDRSDWKYMDQGTENIYSFVDNVGDKSIIGVPLYKEAVNITIDFGNNNESIYVGSILQLAPNVTPSGISLGWSSSDDSVATVDANGRVRGISAGTAVITAFAGNATADCTVTVEAALYNVASVTLDESSLIMQPGGQITLTATVSPDGAPNGIDWSSSDVHVATVDQNGKVTAVGNGTAKIKAASSADPTKYAECDVTVKVSVIGVVIQGLEKNNSGQYVLDLVSSGTQKLVAQVMPDNVANKNINWSSSNGSAISVDTDGNVTALGTGTAVITAASDDDPTIYAECIVTVITKSVIDVTLDQPTLLIREGSYDTLVATVNPTDADNRTVRWYTSDDNIATVDQSGKVMGIGVGKVVVTVVSVSDPSKYAECEVEVWGPAVVVLDPETMTLQIGNSYQLELMIINSESTVTWESTDSDIVSVDQLGVITAKKGGTAVITVKLLSDPTVKDTCIVTVPGGGVDPNTPTSIVLSKTSVNLQVGGTSTVTATVLPSTASQVVTWTSGDNSIATVNGGVITAVAKGSIVITVTTSNNVTAYCTVTVTDPSEGNGNGNGNEGNNNEGNNGNNNNNNGNGSGTKEVDASTVRSGSSTVLGTSEVNRIADIAKDATDDGVKTVVNLDAGTSSVVVESFRTLADSGASLKISTPNGTIVIPSSVMKNIAPSAADGKVEIDVKIVDRSTLSEAQKALISEDAVIFQLTVKSGGVDVHNFRDTVEVSLPYLPPRHGSVSDVYVTYIGDDNTTHNVPFVYSGGYIVIGLTHFSLYAAEYLPSGTAGGSGNSDMDMVLIMIFAVVIIAAMVCCTVVVVRKNKN